MQKSNKKRETTICFCCVTTQRQSCCFLLLPAGKIIKCSRVRVMASKWVVVSPTPAQTPQTMRLTATPDL